MGEPERIWAEQTGFFKSGGSYYNGGRWSDNNKRGLAEYVRADVARAELEAAVLAEREACATGRPANINAASC